MSWSDQVILVTGASSGLGRAISERAIAAGSRVFLAARGAEALEQVVARGATARHRPRGIVADVTDDAAVESLVSTVLAEAGRLDAVIHCVGRSMRQGVLETSPEAFAELFEVNFLAAVRVARRVVPALVESRGSLVLIGSLAGKIATRYYGAYPASKYALAAYAQQLRLEWEPRGLHVLLVSPGPIARAEPGDRYSADAAGVPSDARKPGGGAKLKALDPDRLAEQILTAAAARRVELVLPGRARWLAAIGQLWPRLGDWIIRRST